MRLEKYLHVLRPLLAIRWIEWRASPPPVEFPALVEAVAPPPLQPLVLELIERRRRTHELGLGERVADIDAFIDAFIDAELARHGDAFGGPPRPDMLGGARLHEALNVLFRRTVDGG